MRWPCERSPGVPCPADRQALSRPLSAPAPTTTSPPHRRRPDADPEFRRRGGDRNVAGRGATPRGGSAEWTLEAPVATFIAGRGNRRRGTAGRGSTPRCSPHVSRSGGRQAETIRGHRPQGGKARPGRLRVSVSNGVLHTGNLIEPAAPFDALLPSPGAVRPRPLLPLSSRPGRWNRPTPSESSHCVCRVLRCSETRSDETRAATALQPRDGRTQRL